MLTLRATPNTVSVFDYRMNIVAPVCQYLCLFQCYLCQRVCFGLGFSVAWFVCLQRYAKKLWVNFREISEGVILGSRNNKE